MTHTDWLHLDNAAIIYPVLASERFTHVFRVSATLTEAIDVQVLRIAIENLRHRFPSFFVRIKKGLFWFYFEKNQHDVVISSEDASVCKKINLHQNNGYYFRVLTFQNRISLEMFHALCDGYGGIQFLKAIVFEYLVLLGKKIINDSTILVKTEHPTNAEVEDSYLEHALPKPKKKSTTPRAIIYPGTRLGRNGSALINAYIDSASLLQVAKSYHVSLSEYLVALFIDAFLHTTPRELLLKNEISICVPVNLRNIFDSITLRNFSLYFYVTYQFRGTYPSMEELTEHVKKPFSEERVKDKLRDRLSSNVRISKQIYIRLVPLFIKNFIFRIAYYIHGKRPSTMTISNFGQIHLPESMTPFVKGFTFHMGSGLKPTVALHSYESKTKITFTRAYVEPTIEHYVINELTKSGMNVEIESNYFEKSDIHFERRQNEILS
ncbi:MAG: hypothetical protein AB7U79_07045 [Candidatus Izemoplasmatales bacterium]